MEEEEQRLTDEEALVSELHALEAKEVACRKLKEAAIEDSLKLSVAAVNGAREAHTRWQAVLSGGFPHLPSLLDSAPGFAKKVQQTPTIPQCAADTHNISVCSCEKSNKQKRQRNIPATRKVRQ